jgi:hypothetical protein
MFEEDDLLEDLAKTVDLDEYYLRLLQSFYVFGECISLDEHFVYDGVFSPVHFRHFFIHPPSEVESLERPFWHFLKLTAAHWRSPPRDTLVRALVREYRRRELSVPEFLVPSSPQHMDEDQTDSESDASSRPAEVFLTDLTVQERIRVLYDVICVFIPWDGDYFKDVILQGKELPFARLRFPTFRNNTVRLVAGRFLYMNQEIVAYDGITWDTLFVDNPLHKSRRQADRDTLKLLRELVPDKSVLAFDDRCRRNMALCLQIDSRKRSPRIIERTARRQALDRLAEQSRGHCSNMPKILRVDAIRESRAERLAKREQRKTLQDMYAHRQSSESEGEESESAETIIDVGDAFTEPLRLVLRLPSSQLGASDAEGTREEKASLVEMPNE